MEKQDVTIAFSLLRICLEERGVLSQQSEKEAGEPSEIVFDLSDKGACCGICKYTDVVSQRSGKRWSSDTIPEKQQILKSFNIFLCYTAV